MRCGSEQGKRIVAEARMNGTLLDLTAHHPRKSLILFINGTVGVSPFSVKTIYNRLHRAVCDEPIIERTPISSLTPAMEEAMEEAEQEELDNRESEEEDGEEDDLDADPIQ